MKIKECGIWQCQEVEAHYTDRPIAYLEISIPHQRPGLSTIIGLVVLNPLLSLRYQYLQPSLPMMRQTKLVGVEYNI